MIDKGTAIYWGTYTIPGETYIQIKRQYDREGVMRNSVIILYLVGKRGYRPVKDPVGNTISPGQMIER